VAPGGPHHHIGVSVVPPIPIRQVRDLTSVDSLERVCDRAIERRQPAGGRWIVECPDQPIACC
jgi:hypothetical protein